MGFLSKFGILQFSKQFGVASRIKDQIVHEDNFQECKGYKMHPIHVEFDIIACVFVGVNLSLVQIQFDKNVKQGKGHENGFCDLFQNQH